MTPRIGKHIVAPNDPINTNPHLRLLKAMIPPIMLTIIPKMKIRTKMLDKKVLPPNPTSRIKYGSGVITQVSRNSALGSIIRAKATTIQIMLKTPTVNINIPAVAGIRFFLVSDEIIILSLASSRHP
jgi:hypothetical protein